MEPTAPKLIGGWVIEHPLAYAGAVVLSRLLVRVVSSTLKAIEAAIDNKPSDFWVTCGLRSKVRVGTRTTDSRSSSDYLNSPRSPSSWQRITGAMLAHGSA